ncbi:MAG: alkaline phosphatase D family protein [Gemmatimonadota bacterium]
METFPRSRREFLGQLAALGIGSRLPRPAPARPPLWLDDPFSLGVASGDPRHDSVLLWTRLLPNGVPPITAHNVQWELSADDSLRNVVRRGVAVADGGFGHSVHVEINGLNPDRWYWYRFMSGDAVSDVGRTRTTPPPAGTPLSLRMVVASCQHYEEGLYAAQRHMAAEDVDMALFLGDYIYESTEPGRRRQHGSGEPRSLEEYRARYAVYKSDAALRAAHAAFPWVVTWDDHEVDNNYAALVPQDVQTLTSFTLRRAAAYRAFYENMPLRRTALPAGPDMLLYRTIRFGRLATLQVLDTRQYRDDQSCGDGLRRLCPQYHASDRTVLGPLQERWLRDELLRSGSPWNVLAQQILMTPIDLDPDPGGARYNMDSWNGYPAARDRLRDFIVERRVPGVVTLTGDIHASYANEIPRNPDRGLTEAVAAEFVCTSLSSGGDGTDQLPLVRSAMPSNPWMKYHNARRGYLRCDVTPTEWRSAFRVLPHVGTVDAPISTHSTFVVEASRPGVDPA